jgi:hypothetical protein
VEYYYSSHTQRAQSTCGKLLGEGHGKTANAKNPYLAVLTVEVSNSPRRPCFVLLPSLFGNLAEAKTDQAPAPEYDLRPVHLG